MCKLFFAFDRIKYKRLWPRYLADMHEMKTKHPTTWRELEGGNISVTKSEIPFISIGADHACEHLNRMMKVHSGLVGISNNAKLIDSGFSWLLQKCLVYQVSSKGSLGFK